MSRLFELCKKKERKRYQCVDVIASWMALAGVVTTCCIPGTDGQTSVEGKGHRKGKRAGVYLLGRFCRYFQRYLVRTGYGAIHCRWYGLSCPKLQWQAELTGLPQAPVRGAGTLG